MFKRVIEFALVAGRLALGATLLFWTTLLTCLIGKLALERAVPLGSRLLLALVSLLFAIQAYFAFRILILRRRGGRSRPNFRPPPGGPPAWPIGVPVPVRPRGPWLVRAAAQAIPHDE